MIDCFQQVLDLIIIIRFISINNGTIRKLIRIILQGIDIAKASRGEETFNRLAILGDHQMNLQSIKIPLLASLENLHGSISLIVESVYGHTQQSGYYQSQRSPLY